MDDAVGVISDPFSIDDLVVGGLAAVSAGVEESGDDVLFGTGRVILVPDALGAGTAVFGAGTAVFAAGTAVFGAGTAVLEAGRFHTDIAVSVCNILSDQLFRRPVCRSPLIRVVMGSHKRSGGAVDFHDAGDVVWGGVSDMHGGSFLECSFFGYSFFGCSFTSCGDVKNLITMSANIGDIFVQPFYIKSTVECDIRFVVK